MSAWRYLGPASFLCVITEGLRENSQIFFLKLIASNMTKGSNKMQANSLLSIVIPTCNRADFLNFCLDVHIPLARMHNVAIYIFDNASVDGTKDVVEARIIEYPLIHYFCNEHNIGPDANFETALKYPDTEYIWLLGDTYRIPDEGINYFIKLISSTELKYDAIVLNLAGKIKTIHTQNFSDGNSLLRELGALMTCLSCLIFNKELLKKANFKKYHNSFYLQTGIIFESISDADFLIHWAKTISISGLGNRYRKKNMWSMTTDVFEIAGVKWISFIMSLPNAYTLESKIQCIKNFSIVSGIFSIRHLLLLRGQNILNNKTYSQYSYLFPFLSNTTNFIWLAISLLPKVFVKILVKIRHVLKKFQQSPNKFGGGG